MEILCVIFGHTYTPEPIVMPNKIGIDTMHRGGGLMTAVILDDDDPQTVRFVQAGGNDKSMRLWGRAPADIG